MIGGFLAAGRTEPAFAAKRLFLSMATTRLATAEQRVAPDREAAVAHRHHVIDDRRA